jgi:hypothetical protein
MIVTHHDTVISRHSTHHVTVMIVIVTHHVTIMIMQALTITIRVKHCEHQFFASKIAKNMRHASVVARQQHFTVPRSFHLHLSQTQAYQLQLQQPLQHTHIYANIHTDLPTDFAWIKVRHNLNIKRCTRFDEPAIWIARQFSDCLRCTSTSVTVGHCQINRMRC